MKSIGWQYRGEAIAPAASTQDDSALRRQLFTPADTLPPVSRPNSSPSPAVAPAPATFSSPSPPSYPSQQANTWAPASAAAATPQQQQQQEKIKIRRFRQRGQDATPAGKICVKHVDVFPWLSHQGPTTEGLAKSSMPLSFGGADAAARAAFFHTTNPTSSHFVAAPFEHHETAPIKQFIGQTYALRKRSDEDIKRIKQLHGYCDETPGHQTAADLLADLQNKKNANSRVGLMRTSISIGSQPVTYESVTRADFAPKPFSAREHSCDALHHTRTTMVLGTDKPMYESAAMAMFQEKPNSRRQPMGKPKSMLVLGMDEPAFATQSQNTYTQKGTVKVSQLGSTAALQRSHLCLGTHKEKHISETRDAFHQSFERHAVAAPLHSKAKLMSSKHLVLGKDKPDYRTVYGAAYSEDFTD